MNYFQILRKFWTIYTQRDLKPIDGFLYLFLVEVCNFKLWPKKFTLPNNYILHSLRISDKTLIASRKRLVQVGLIEFQSGKATQECSIYHIVDPQYVRPKPKTPVDESNGKKAPPQNTVQPTGNNPVQSTDNNPVQSTGNNPGELPENDGTYKNSNSNTERQKETSKENPEAGASGDQCVDGDLFLKIKNEFNQTCHNQKEIKTLSKSCKRRILDCINLFGVEQISLLIKKTENSNFLNGCNSFDWVAEFNWIFNPEHAECILEGVYDNKTLKATGKDNNASF